MNLYCSLYRGEIRPVQRTENLWPTPGRSCASPHWKLIWSSPPTRASFWRPVSEYHSARRGADADAGPAPSRAAPAASHAIPPNQRMASRSAPPGGRFSSSALERVAGGGRRGHAVGPGEELLHVLVGHPCSRASFDEEGGSVSA